MSGGAFLCGFEVYLRDLRDVIGFPAAMKSSYELAMERLAKSDPDAGKKLSPEQKARLAEIDAVFKGKIAEREIFLKKQYEESLSDGKYDEAEKIRGQIASERTRLEEERDDEKERVRRERKG